MAADCGSTNSLLHRLKCLIEESSNFTQVDHVPYKHGPIRIVAHTSRYITAGSFNLGGKRWQSATPYAYRQNFPVGNHLLLLIAKQLGVRHVTVVTKPYNESGLEDGLEGGELDLVVNDLRHSPSSVWGDSLYPLLLSSQSAAVLHAADPSSIVSVLKPFDTSVWICWFIALALLCLLVVHEQVKDHHVFTGSRWSSAVAAVTRLASAVGNTGHKLVGNQHENIPAPITTSASVLIVSVCSMSAIFGIMSYRSQVMAMFQQAYFPNIREKQRGELSAYKHLTFDFDKHILGVIARVPRQEAKYNWEADMERITSITSSPRNSATDILHQLLENKGQIAIGLDWPTAQWIASWSPKLRAVASGEDFDISIGMVISRRHSALRRHLRRIWPRMYETGLHTREWRRGLKLVNQGDRPMRLSRQIDYLSLERLTGLMSIGILAGICILLLELCHSQMINRCAWKSAGAAANAPSIDSVLQQPRQEDTNEDDNNVIVIRF